MFTLTRQIVALVAILMLASCVWQTEYDKLAGEKQALTATNKSLEQTAGQSAQQVRTLTGQLTHLTESKRALEQRQLDTSQTINRLEERIRSRDRAMGELERRNARLRDSLQDHQREGATSTAERQAIIDTHLKNIATLEAERAELHLSLQQTQAALGRARQAEQRVMEQQIVMERLEGQTLAVSRENTELAQRAQSLDREKALLAQQNSLLGQKVTELEEVTVALAGTGRNLEAQILGFKDTTTRQTLRMAELTNAVDRLQAEKTDLEQQVAAQVLEVQTAMLGAATQVEAVQAQSQRKLQQMEGALAQTMQSLEQSQLATATVAAEKQELGQQLVLLTSEKDVASRELQAITLGHQATVTSLQSQITSKQQQTSQLESQNQAVKEELATLNARATELQKSNADATADLAKQRALNANLKRQLAQATADGGPPNPQTPITTASMEELIRRQFFHGQIVYNKPAEMTVGESERIEVRIGTPDQKEITANIDGKGTLVIEEKEISTFMAVTLKGNNFQIDANNDTEQVVRQTGITRWDFDVLPLQGGKQTLELIISKRIVSPGMEDQKITIPTIRADIDVKVNPIYTTRSFLERHWQWIIGTLLGSGIIGWAYARIRQRRKGTPA